VLIPSERPTIAESDPQPTGSKTFPASGTQARAVPGRDLCREPPWLAPQNDSNQANSSNISVPSPPPPQLPSPSLSSFTSTFPYTPFSRTRFPSFRINIQDFPRLSSSFYSFLLSLPSYSPISSPEELPRPTSPANSTTSSVVFIDEVPIPPPQPRHYYYDSDQSLDNLILQFPQRTTPLPPGSYSIGPDNFDLFEIRSTISGQNPDFIISVFLPISPFPYDVPVRFFYNLFPPSTAIIREID